MLGLKSKSGERASKLLGEHVWHIFHWNQKLKDFSFSRIVFLKLPPEGLKTVIFYASPSIFFQKLKKIEEPQIEIFLLGQVADCMQQEVWTINESWCDILKMERPFKR